ncbi:sensor histidine kinase, partial [Catellatospora methionotrophica]|uniref:sensor histidine kinase n=1 Tax=Catellatospora methionotrophica TaxID=121620 RepID=UPI0033C83071
MNCPAPPPAAAAAATVGVTVLTAVALWGAGGRYLLLDVATSVVAVAMAPILPRRPVAGAIVVNVLAALSPVATPAATMGSLVTARLRPFGTAARIALLGVAAHAVQGWWRAQHGLSYGWWLLLMCVAYAALTGWGAWWRARAALIASLRERTRQLEQEQERRVAEARAGERARIAREMHDVLAHRLSLVATYAGALEYRPDLPPQRIAEAAGVVREGVHQALDELREVITLLRDATEEDLPAPTLDDLPALVADWTRVGQVVRVDGRVAAAVPPTAGRAAYRVLQEAVTNARKHAPGEPVAVALSGEPGGSLVIEVRNALAAPAGMAGAGAGLAGLAERVRLAGGRLQHDTDGV